MMILQLLRSMIGLCNERMAEWRKALLRRPYLKLAMPVVLCCICMHVQAQLTSGLTGIPDTGFNNRSAYQRELKYRPYVKLVERFSLKTVKEQMNVTYCQSGTRALQLDVFSPAARSRKARPAIVIIHGGGWRSGNRTQHHPLAQQLANRGYVCFTPEYRLSTEALYPAGVHDLKASLRYIKANAQRLGVDTNRIAVLGFSAGGQLATLLGVTGNNPAFEGDSCNMQFGTGVQAIVDVDGTLSFVHPESAESNDTNKSISASTYWFGYNKKERYDLLEAASPLTHVGPHTPPTLFLNSSVVHMHAGRDDYMKVMNQYGIYAEVYTFEDSPHIFPLLEPWFHQVVDRTDAFLKKLFVK